MGTDRLVLNFDADNDSLSTALSDFEAVELSGTGDNVGLTITQGVSTIDGANTSGGFRINNWNTQENLWIIGGSGNDWLNGYSLNYSITGGADNDTINGNSGDDTLVGGTGDDSIFGSSGND